MLPQIELTAYQAAVNIPLLINIATDVMFVGKQKVNFIRRLKQSAAGDVYLTGALYFINDWQDAALEAELIKACTSTEKILFALSLFQNHERVFTIFKHQLLSLRGLNRTMPVIGSMKILDWLIVWLTPHHQERQRQGPVPVPCPVRHAVILRQAQE